MQHIFIPKITRTNTQITGIGIFTITVQCTVYGVHCTLYSILKGGGGVQINRRTIFLIHSAISLNLLTKGNLLICMT